MSKQFTKIISKITNGLKFNECTKCNETSITVDQTMTTNSQASKAYQIQCPNTPVKSISNSNLLKKNEAKSKLVLDQTVFNEECNNLTMNISEFPLLEITPEKKRQIVSSTFIKNDSLLIENISDKSPSLSQILENDECENQYEHSSCINAFSNNLYESPVVQTSRFNETALSNDHTRFSQIYQESIGFHSNDFQSAKSILFEAESINETNNRLQDEELYVCCISYDALTEHELSIEFSERLQVYPHSNKYYRDFYLVKNITTQECGFVPAYCICKLFVFLKDIKKLSK
ncbi:unnamed protein product [Brachionus calyciflorus]|uniref:SH3 domain-containing protein n=1 Tax=Brachionus calyciflorus TaxID=104777 RepID=A0A813Q068_9BILA|nr:unnamed protein product [Brachionus calyciflorus]